MQKKKRKKKSAIFEVHAHGKEKAFPLITARCKLVFECGRDVILSFYSFRCNVNRKGKGDNETRKMFECWMTIYNSCENGDRR